jgi:hypothetical protein
MTHNTKTPAELAAAKWEGSGLSSSEAKKLKFRVMSAEQTAAMSNNFVKASSLVMPYFNWRGQPTKFFRIRYLEKPPGFAGLVEKPQRYAQPIGTLNEIYTPPLVDWSKILKDADIPLFITEGELKAASACKHGFPTLGLGGVDVWRSQKNSIPFLKQLEDVTWKGRNVFIVFDSDSATNPNVLRAQIKLCEALTSRGAQPNIVSLPTLHGKDKTGLDDFLVAKHANAFRTLVEEAAPFSESMELWTLNAEVTYIREPGFVVVRKDGRKINPSAFKEHAYSNRFYWEPQIGKDGTKLKKKPLAPKWLSWENRYELSRIVYAPGEPSITERNEWNAWHGWGLEPKKGSIAPWEELLDYMFGAKVDEREWFERWCAYPLQHPGTKMYSAAVVWGTKHGTGKSMIGYSLMKIYGGNATEIREKDLKGDFNEWAENRQFVMGDDVTGDSARAYNDQLKAMITQETLWVNAKFIPKYRVKDCINYYFTSNHPDAFFLEDQDRRYFIHEAPIEPLPQEFYKRYDEWLHGDGPKALFHHLLNLNLGSFDPKAHAMMTSAKRIMIMDGKSDMGLFCANFKADPGRFMRVISEEAARKADLLSADQILQVYDPERATKVTTNGLTRELRRSGFRQANDGSPVRTDFGLSRLYIVRNHDVWMKATPKAAALHWNTIFGKKERKF